MWHVPFGPHRQSCRQSQLANAKCQQPQNLEESHTLVRLDVLLPSRFLQDELDVGHGNAGRYVNEEPAPEISPPDELRVGDQVLVDAQVRRSELHENVEPEDQGIFWQAR